MLVRGEAGVGKSALIDAAVAAAGGVRALRARGYESDTEIPYAGLQAQFCRGGSLKRSQNPS